MSSSLQPSQIDSTTLPADINGSVTITSLENFKSSTIEFSTTPKISTNLTNEESSGTTDQSFYTTNLKNESDIISTFSFDTNTITTMTRVAHYRIFAY